MKKKIVYVSACVILDFDFRILLSKRPENTNFSGFWEFPGGKLKNNETPELTVKRELYEAMKLICSTDKGPNEQNNSIGCSIKWKQ